MHLLNRKENSNGMLSSDKGQKAILCLILFISFILICFLNWLYPLNADDWGYFPAIRTDVSNIFLDIFHRQYNQYLTWGGRSVVHSIAHFLLWMGSPANDIVNSLAYIAYLFLIYSICNKGRRVNPQLFLILSLVLWFVLPTFNSTVLWIVGSANYLWGALIVILFMYPYYSYYISEKHKSGILHVCIFFFTGIIAGWTNENMVVALGFFILGIFYLLRRNNRRIPAWAVSGLIGVCIGGIVMLLAPGNYIRAEVVSETLGLADKSVLENILYRIMKTGYRYLVYVLPVVVIYIIILFFFRKYREKSNANRKQLECSLLFFLSGHIACAAMAASAIFPQRALLGIISLLVIATGLLYNNINTKETKYKWINFGIISVLLIAFLISYYFEYRNINMLAEKFEQRELYIDQQLKSGNKNIVFDEQIELPSKYQFEDLTEDPEYWLNRSYSYFHGIDSVRVILKK